MFGINLWKIVAFVVVILLCLGYFKYTQDKMAALNQEIAQKEFALKTAQATIEQQIADTKKLAAVQQRTFDEMQSARARASQLEAMFSRQDLNRLGTAKPGLIERQANTATDRLLRCIEDVINKGSENAPGC